MNIVLNCHFKQWSQIRNTCHVRCTQHWQLGQEDMNCAARCGNCQQLTIFCPSYSIKWPLIFQSHDVIQLLQILQVMDLDTKTAKTLMKMHNNCLDFESTMHNTAKNYSKREASHNNLTLKDLVDNMRVIEERVPWSAIHQLYIQLSSDLGTRQVTNIKEHSILQSDAFKSVH